MTTLHCNVVSHWLSPYPERSLLHTTTTPPRSTSIVKSSTPGLDTHMFQVEAWKNYRPHRWWRHNEGDGFSNHRRLDCLLSRLFRCRSKKTSKLRVIGLCEENPPVTGGFPSHRAVTRKIFPFDDVIMGLVQDCRISRALTMEILQCCTMPSIYVS